MTADEITVRLATASVTRARDGWWEAISPAPRHVIYLGAGKTAENARHNLRRRLECAA